MARPSSPLFRLALAIATLVSVLHPSANAFVTTPLDSTMRASSGSSSSLHMVFGAKQALALEKAKNPQKVESTIQGLMTTKNLSRDAAEKRYGEFLLDPNGFALRAADQEREEKGYKDWKEQAIAKSSDPEATRKRIDEFQKRNSIKGTAIIVLFFTAVSIYNTMNPYVPPVH